MNAEMINKQNASAPGAVVSLVCGILGVVLVPLGVILGPIAIFKARAARSELAQSPELDGDGLATAGLVLGIVGLVIGALPLAILVVALLLASLGAAPFIYSTF